MDYKSKTRILGLPLVHICTGRREDGHYKRGVAKGWIAYGDISLGIVLSLGGIAFGGLAFGGLGLGILSVAGLACGVLSFGGGALGVLSYGGLALGSYAAYGGVAIAGKYAVGAQAAIGEHANDVFAIQYFAQSHFFRVSVGVGDSIDGVVGYLGPWYAVILLAVLLLPTFVRWLRRRYRLRRA